MPFPGDLDKSGAPPFMLKDQGPTLGWARNYNAPPDSAGVNAQVETTDGAGHITFQPGTASLSWINVKTFGATGNGTTDDTFAINSAITAFNSAGGGVLYFPTGIYKTTTALTTITGNGIVKGDGMGSNNSTGAGLSQITSTTTNASVFTINSSLGPLAGFALTFMNLWVSNTATVGTQVAGSAGITVTGSDQYCQVNYENVRVDGFYINIDIQTGLYWSMVNVHSSGYIFYGLKIQNVNNHDAGDWSMVNCAFDKGNSSWTGGQSGLRWESSGGGKLSNTKFIGPTVNCIDIAADGSTTDMFISNCGFEGFSGIGVKVSGLLPNLAISNGEFGFTSGAVNAISIANSNIATINNITINSIPLSGPAINIDTSNNIAITNIVYVANGVSAIQLKNINEVTIDNIVNSGTISVALIQLVGTANNLTVGNILQSIPSAVIGGGVTPSFGNTFNDILGSYIGGGYGTIANVTAASATGPGFKVTSPGKTNLIIDSGDNAHEADLIFSQAGTNFFNFFQTASATPDLGIFHAAGENVTLLRFSNTAGGDITLLARRLVAAAATTGRASLNIPTSGGAAPSSPVDGDMWYDGTNVKFRVGGTTKTFTLT